MPPPCPALPCLSLPEFISACEEQKDAAVIRTIWIERGMFEDGFYASAHFVAENPEGAALRCSDHYFGEARNLAYIESFLRKLRVMLDIA